MLEVDIEVARESFRLKAAFTSGAPVVALFGRSGSGKTTLVQAIAGLVTPTRGRIALGERVLFDSERRIDLPPEQRRVGYVFQEGLLFPHLSVRANLAYGEKLTEPAERFVEHETVIALLGLQALLDRRPHTLSGGEKQRVAIGRALLASPRLLLMDEPLASLDAARKGEILAYIEKLRDALKLPIVYVSHAIEEVTRLADHLVVLADGQVVAQGPAVDVLARPELSGQLGAFEGGALLETRVAGHDERYGLTTLAFAGGTLVVPRVEAGAGEALRARVRARDVSLALKRPAGVSIQNILPATVLSLAPSPPDSVDVQLDLGGSRLLARVTRKAADELALAPGSAVHALVKSVSIDRASVGLH